MIIEEIKIGNQVIGKAFIETSMGKHEAIEIWIPRGLVMCALNSGCKNITIVSE